jgi:hypothetical protein
LSHEKTATIGKQTSPVDPGCLPAWEVDELPQASPPNYRRWWLLIGPGLVMAGGSIGTGEWVMGAKSASLYGGALFWVVLVSIIGQVLLNTEAMRYTLCTGEPMMTGFLRTKPGPKFWLLFYLLLDFGTWLPSLSALGAQILVVAVQGLTPQDTINPDVVRYVSYAVFIGCATLVLFGGKIYNTLEWVLGGKFLFVLFYLSFCCLLFVSLETWWKIWSGLFDITRLPRDPVTGAVGIDWSLISALAGFSGIGGLGNIMASNFVREKGWGMGSKVGAIPSAFGGHHLTLSHIGTMCQGGKESARRLKVWLKYVFVDQYILWALGSLIGMMLPSMLGAEFLQPRVGVKFDDWQWAAAMAQDFGAAKGQIFRYLTLLCGLVIFIPGQFSVVDGVARRWCDAVWSGSGRARRMDPHNAKWVYYTFAAIYVLWGVTALTVFTQLSGAGMMKIAGSMANLSIAATMLHALYVNYRFLPEGTRPPLAKQIALALSAVFFLVMFSFVVNQRVVPIVQQYRQNSLVAAVVLFVVLIAVGVWSHRSVRREQHRSGG